MTEWVPQSGAPDTWRGRNRCPWCRTEQDAASGIRKGDARKPPQAGDCSICWHCGRVSTFDADGGRVFPTQQQLDTFLADSGVQTALVVWSLLRSGRMVPPSAGQRHPQPGAL